MIRSLHGQAAQSTFGVRAGGLYTIHALAIHIDSLSNLSISPGVTTVPELSNLITQSGICAELDEGVQFEVEDCLCPANAGALRVSATALPCYDGLEPLTLAAETATPPTVPEGYEVVYVLTHNAAEIIEAFSDTPVFSVSDSGRFAIHTLVYDPSRLDLLSIALNQTTAADLLQLIEQSNHCIAAWEATGAIFEIDACFCAANAGSLVPTNSPGCFEGQGELFLKFNEGTPPVIPPGYELAYFMTRGNNRVIQRLVNSQTVGVQDTGTYEIIPIVFNPNLLDLNTLSLGQTTYDELAALIASMEVCASLGAGARFQILPCGPIQISPDSLHLTGQIISVNAIELDWVFFADFLANFDHELERSIDGLYFESIAQFEDTSQGTHYTDRSFGNVQKLFYRIKLVHSAGVYGYSNVVEFDLESLNLSQVISIFPNPTTGIINFRALDPQDGRYFLEVFTADSRQVHFEAINNFTQDVIVDLSRLTPGIYYVAITQPNGEPVGFRIVIERQ